MVVCNFFLRGQCKFGSNCRNEHPDAGQSAFATSWGRPAVSSKPGLPYNAANIASDLNPKVEKPMWPLSSYAPFKYEPTLIGGLDISPEEMRVRAVQALQAGNANEYMQYEAAQIAAAEQAYAAARNNPSQTFEQATRQTKLLSNSNNNTTMANTTLGNTTMTPSAFGAPSTTATSTFGQPSFGQAPSSLTQPVGQSVFAQTSTPAATSAFGSGSGATQPMSAFDQPSTTTTTATTPALGQSAFGQTSLAAGGSSVVKPAAGAFGAFADTSAFGIGAGAKPNNAMGGSSSGGGGGFAAFAGQPSAFGLAAAAKNVTAATGGSVFGQPSFGQPTNATTTTTTTTNAFAAPSQQPQHTNAFGSLTTNTGSIFGSFGQPTPMVTNVQPAASVFSSSSSGGQTQRPQGLSAFGNMNTSGPNPPSTSAFGLLAPQQPTSLVLPTAGLVPSISMASSTSGLLSALPASSPMSVFGQSFSKPQQQQQPQQPESSSLSSASSKTTTTTIDFATAIARTTYRPGSTPYDSQLPPNYAAILPPWAGEAFKMEKFGWPWKGDGKAAVPEWIPPVDVR